MYFISSPGDGRYGLLKLLNIASDKTFSANDIEFSIPTRNDNNVDSRNTKVVVYFKGSKGFYGSKTLYYNRTHISQLPTLEIQRNGALTYAAVIDNINTQYNLFLTSNDIIDGPLPDIVSSLITVTLPLNPNSYKFYDGIEIVVDPFEPEYVLYKSTDTLLSYLCVGFDRWAQYTDDDGNIYQMMVEQNSYECGYNDVNPRILLTRPNSLLLLEEDTSDVFTLEYLNPTSDVTVTITSPGLTISQSSFILSAGSPIGTFTVTSNSPGVFNIAITNNLGITNPVDTTITFSDKYNTTYSVEPPPLNKVIKGISTANFLVSGYVVDPDEDVTITIHTQNGLTASEVSVLLTVAEPEAVFTVVAANEGTYGLTFTNNRNLSNPAPINIDVLNPGTIELTPPSTGIANGIQSDVFTATLVDGLEEVTVTPSFTGSATVTPASFVLSPSNPTGTFRVTYAVTGAQTLSITNSGFAINPVNYDFTVLTKPTLIITAPTEPIYSSQTSDAFTITLVDGYRSVTVNISSNVTFLSTSSVVLTPASPSATFTVRANVGGNYFVSFNNNGGLVNPENEIVEILQVYNTSYLATAPASTNLIINQVSNSFTVTASDINPTEPVTVSIATSANLTANKTEVVLTSASPTNTFTVVSDTEGSYTVTLTNDRGLSNPPIFNVAVIDPGYLTLDVAAGDEFVNQNSDPFTVRLINGYQPITVSLNSSGATFNPTTLLLSEAEPEKTFTVRYGASGNKTISLTNNGLTINPTPVVIPVYKVPSITVTTPSNPTYQNFESDNFTITLANGYKDVTVSITSNTDEVSVNSVLLTVANPTATFTITEASTGSFNVSFTNSENYSMTNSLNFTVNEFSQPAITINAPTEQIYVGENSSNFTVSIVNPVEPVLITINSNANTVNPLTVTLSPSVTSATFTVQYSAVAAGYVGITNDKGYSNPADISFNVIERPPASLTLNRLTTGNIYREVAQTFTVSITNPLNNTLITPTFSGGLGSIGGAFNLNETTSVRNFTFTPTNPGIYTVGITNNAGIDNPTSIDIEVLNGEILLRTPATTLSAIVETDWFEIELVDYNQITIIDLVLTGAADTSVIIDPTDIYQSTRIILSSNNKIGRFKLVKPTAGVFTLGISNDKGLVSPANVELTFYAPPQLLLEEPTITTSFLNNNIGDYTVTLINYNEEITVRPQYDKLLNDPHKESVVLFLDFQGESDTYSHFDNSSRNYVINTITSNGSSGIALSDVEPINGFTSALFLNSEDYLSVTELNNDFRFSNDFTIEIDFKTTSIGKMLLDMNSSSGAYWYLWINMAGQIEWRSSVSVTPIASTEVVNNNLEQRVAVSRTGNLLTLFLNGNSVGTFVNSGIYDSTSPTLYIGAQGNVRDIAKDFIGNISKVKITKGVGRYTANYIPEALKVLKFIPEFLILNDIVTNGTFEVQSSAASTYSINLIGDSEFVAPEQVNLTFELTPIISFTPATGPFYYGEESGDFAIELLDASSDVEITITKDANIIFLETPVNLVGDTFILNAVAPSTSFTLEASSVGTYSFVLTNNKGLTNPAAFSYVAEERTNAVLSLVPPEILNIEINSISDPFTVNLLGTEIVDVTVTPSGSPNLVFDPTSFLLNQSNKVATFTVTSNIADNYEISLNRNPAITVLDPVTSNIVIMEQASIQITDSPNIINSNVETGNFEVTLLNPFQDILVTPIVEDGVSIPESFTLTAAEPVATFTILFNSYGYKTLSFNTSPSLSLIDSEILIVEPQVLIPDITLDAPTDLFINVESNNFILTLNNGPWEYDQVTGLIVIDENASNGIPFVPVDVNVTISSVAVGFSKTTFVLNANNNEDVFTLNNAIGGPFTITVSNDSSAVNPTPLVIDIGDQLTVNLIAPTEPLYKSKSSWPFTVSVDFLTSDVLITPTSSDISAEFIPPSLILTPSSPTGTFRVKSNEIGPITVSTENNSGFLNSTVNVNIENIDPFFEYTEFLFSPDINQQDNLGYNNFPIVNQSGPLINNSTSFRENDPILRNLAISGGNGNTITLAAEEKYYSFKEDFCFEFVISLSAPGRSPLINFNYSNASDGKGLVIQINGTDKSFEFFQRNSVNSLIYQTAPNTLPAQNVWFYLVFQNISGQLKTHIDTGSGIVEIGSFAFTNLDITANPNFTIFGSGSYTGHPSSSATDAKIDVIRFTSKARYLNNDFPQLSDLQTRFLSISAPSIRMFKPNRSYIDKNVLSEPITVMGVNLTEPTTITPVSLGQVYFTPQSFILTPANPTATFHYVYNESGVFTISLDNDKFIDIIDNFSTTVIEEDPLYENTLVIFVPGAIVNENNVTDQSKYRRQLTKYSSPPYGYVSKSQHAKFDTSLETSINTISRTYFTITDNSFDFSNTDFCIEGNCYFADGFDLISEFPLLDNVRTSSVQPNEGFRIIIKPIVRKMLFVANSNTTYLIPEEETPGTLPGALVNFSFAVEYVGNTLSIYIDGNLYVSKSNVQIPSRAVNGGYVTFGGTASESISFRGGIDQIRITKGAYRYGAPYTVSDVPFSYRGVISLLITPPSELSILDNEISKEFTITATGIKNNCLVTIISNNPGIIFSQNEIELTPDLLTSNFTVSGAPGVYEITFSNNLLLENSDTFTVTIYDNTLISVSSELNTENYLFNDESVDVTLSLNNPVIDVETKIYSDPLHGDPYRNNVVLMLDFQGDDNERGFREHSIHNYDFEWNGSDIALKEINAINGKTSLFFPGTVNSERNYIKITAPENNLSLIDNFKFDGDFTFEFSIYSPVTYAYKTLFRFGQNNQTYYELSFDSARRIRWIDTVSGDTNPNIISLSSNTVYNIAVSKIGNNLYFFVDGILINTLTSIGSISPIENSFLIGTDYSLGSQQNYIGYIGFVKITKGIGRYDSSYLVPQYQYPTIVPSKTILNENNPNSTLLITSEFDKVFNIKFETDKVISKPNDLEIGFFSKPVINLNLPNQLIIDINGVSDTFILSLSNPSLVEIEIEFVLPNEITIFSYSPNETFVSGNKFILSEAIASLEVKFTSSTIGNFPISIINNKGLPNPDSFNVLVKIPDISLIGPNPNNEIYLNEESGDFTIAIDTISSPLTITITLTAGLSFIDLSPEIKVRDIVFDSTIKQYLFKLISFSTSENDYITITNSGAAINPSPMDVLIIDRPTIPNNLQNDDYNLYLVGEDTDDRNINLFQGFF